VCNSSRTRIRMPYSKMDKIFSFELLELYNGSVWIIYLRLSTGINTCDTVLEDL